MINSDTGVKDVVMLHANQMCATMTKTKHLLNQHVYTVKKKPISCIKSCRYRSRDSVYPNHCVQGSWGQIGELKHFY